MKYSKKMEPPNTHDKYVEERGFASPSVLELHNTMGNQAVAEMVGLSKQSDSLGQKVGVGSSTGMGDIIIDILSDLHFDTRDELNGKAPEFEEIQNSDCRLMSEKDTILHDNGDSNPEYKYTCPIPGLNPGSQEYVYDGATKEAIEEGPLKGTYNYVDPAGINNWGTHTDIIKNVGHAVFDIAPHLIGGTEQGNEETTSESHRNILGEPKIYV